MRLAALLTVGLAGQTALAQPAPRPITVELDARDAPRRLLHARLTVPARPGPMTLLYPEWLPGEHGPTGPIVNVAGLAITAAGKPVPWRRDSDNMYTFHVEVPAGADALRIELDVLLPADAKGFTSAASSTPELANLAWNHVLLYPKGVAPDEQQIAATLRLPPGWKAGTSLPVQRDGGNVITYRPASLTTMVDAPVLAGAHTRVLALKSATPPVRLFVAADAEGLLEPRPALLAGLQKLPVEAAALFGTEHYRGYTFLLTLSDTVAWFGLEHHESSDNRVSERFFIDDEHRLANAGLLPHELVHSWNGKYRRPAGMKPGRLDQPMNGELLWVYEGLTEYLGKILTARSGLYSAEEYRDSLALAAAEMEISSGRAWRPLVDTGVAAQILYGAADEGSAWRRSVDFYSEGELIWLEVDTIIRARTGGKASLDDFCRKFHGGAGGQPRVVPYELEDVLAALQAIAPHDWKSFFEERVYATRPKAPVAGIEAAGWKLVYGEEMSAVHAAEQAVDELIDERWSIGISVTEDGTIPDVIPGSPAARAGVPPGAKLIAVNGRKWSEPRLRDAVRESKKRKRLELIVESGEIVRSHALGYAGGSRFPRLERIASKPDVLGAIIAPLGARRETN